MGSSVEQELILLRNCELMAILWKCQLRSDGTLYWLMDSSVGKR